MIENEKCRLCLIKKENSIDIFSEEGINLNISQILTQHFWFKSIETDDISKTICFDCWSTVDIFNKFYNCVKIAHKTLCDARRFATEATNEENLIKLENIENAVPTITNSLDNVTSLSADGTSNSNNNEAVEDFSYVANQFLEIYTEDDKLHYDDKITVPESSSPSQQSLDDDTYVPPVMKKRFKRQVIRSVRSTRFQNSSAIQKVRSQETSRKVKISEIEKRQEDEMIRQYCRMECDLCQVKFDKFLDAKSHYRLEHKRAGYILCNNNDCKKRFFRRFRILEHISTHFNPDIFRCDICKKVCADKSSLKEHLDVHVPPENRKFRCDKCPKSYTKKYQLDTHNTSHMSEEDKKFICNVCDKPFATNLILQTHKRCVHECVTHICEICAKVFKNKGYFEKHLLEHQNVKMPKVQCQICGQWYKNDQGLRKHIRKHEESKELHICDICGKHSPNKTALRSHKKYSHVIERDFKCHICDKAFKKALVLKEHMTLHTGEVLYKCPYCPKTFNSSANMHSHKKKIHVKEWAENRKNLQP